MKLTAAAIASALLAAAGLAAPSQGSAAGEPLPQTGLVRLSNERSLTRIAYPEELVRVRQRPDPASAAGPRLRDTTEHGSPEVYLALVETEGADGERWVKIRLPGRPNGQTGWVPRSALGSYRIINKSLEVDRRTLRVSLYRYGRRVLRFPIGVGARTTPTPGGHFWVREKLTYRRDPLYGDRALGTSAYAPKLENWPLGGVIGMHGTGEPELIPGRPSHGCIRMKNPDIRRLYRAVPVGTPVRIL